MNPEIKIRNAYTSINVRSPYDRDFIDFAHSKDAEWDGDFRVWKFDVDDEADVRDAVLHIYGTDGEKLRITQDDLDEVAAIVAGHEDVESVEIVDADTGNGYIVAHVISGTDGDAFRTFAKEATPDGWSMGGYFDGRIFIKNY